MGELPNRIRALRVAHGWSQDALAAAVGCSKPQISDLERGNVQLTVDWMRRIAHPLGVAPAELLNDQDNPGNGLAPDEIALLARLRLASEAERESIMKVADALLPRRAVALKSVAG